ncbi:MAG: hypothetical protein R2736_03060 [Solirubrobacterales bacterium]
MRSTTGATASPSAAPSRCAASASTGPCAREGTQVSHVTSGCQARNIRQRTDHLVVEASRAQTVRDRRPPPRVADARQGPPGLDLRLRRDLAHPALGVGRHPLGLEHQRLRAQVQLARAHECRVEGDREARLRAHRAAAAVLRVGVVELLLQRVRIRQRPSVP